MTRSEAVRILQLAAWRRAAGFQASEDLPDLAVRALVAGVDSPALQDLAGISRGSVREAAEAFDMAVHERADEQTALWEIVREAARDVVAGVADPLQTARWIWSEISHRFEPEGDLRIFIGLASEFDDHPEARAVLEQQTIRAAEELLSRPRPRRWLRLQAPGTVSRDTVLSLDTASGQDPVNPEDLGLPPELVADVHKWHDQWTAKFPSTGEQGFASLADADTFVECGRTLALDIQQALGPTWHVEYYQEPVRPPGVRLRPDPAGGSDATG